MPRTARLASNPATRRAILNSPFTIIIDTREQERGGDAGRFTFQCITAPLLQFDTVVEYLPEGDYSAVGYNRPQATDLPAPPCIAIERKSIGDAFHSFGADRERFEAEIVRLSRWTFAAVVIEADWQTIGQGYQYSELDPKVIYRTAMSWAIKYGVHFYAMPGREWAEKWTHRLLEMFVRKCRGGEVGR